MATDDTVRARSAAAEEDKVTLALLAEVVAARPFGKSYAQIQRGNVRDGRRQLPADDRGQSGMSSLMRLGTSAAISRAR